MFGVGFFEMIILGLVCLVPVVAGAVVLVVMLMNKKPRDADE